MDLQGSKIDLLIFGSGFGATGSSVDGNSSLQIGLEEKRACPASCTMHHGLCYASWSLFFR